jgi:uncharacterized protein YjbI with pentapeptide repeats
MSRLAAAMVVVWLFMGFGLHSAPADAKPQIREARELVSLLRAGRPVLLDDGTTIAGDLNIGPRTVRAPFVCRRCTLTGNIYGSYARFQHGIDLSGSTVKGNVDLDGAVFFEPARFGVAGSQGRGSSNLPACLINPNDTDHAGASFGGKVNFSFAVFNDVVDFEEVDFCRPIQFTSTRFASIARFGSASFGAGSIFRGARFAKEAVFEHGLFAGPADFRAVTFDGVADFRAAQFAALDRGVKCRPVTVCFEDAVFRGRSDFSRTTFFPHTDFDDAYFADDAVFRRAVFYNSASFERGTIGGWLDFKRASLTKNLQLLNLSAGGLSFDGTTFNQPFTINAEDVRPRDIEASVGVIDLVGQAQNRGPLLHVLEQSAKERGDLGLANDAHYRLQELAARNDGFPRQVADYVIYRWVAGYLVRPWNPLVCLVIIVLVAALLRLFWPSANEIADSSGHPARESPVRGDQSGAKSVQNTAHLHQRLGRQVGSLPGRFVNAVLETIFGRREHSSLRRVEVIVYAFLFACFLVAVGSSNPTLRDMIDAVT